MTNLNTPVLFLIFNRPETTELVFERIREAQPPRLYIASDGPRPGREGEIELCQQARGVINLVNWNCEVQTLIRDENLGCGKAVSSAIDWFFENEEYGIILEDDCLPDLSFFLYCEELLKYYLNNQEVGVISGNQFVNADRLKTSYYFSNYPHIWGWATWRRVWNNYDFKMKDWPLVKQTQLLLEKTGSVFYADKWQSIFDRVYNGIIDTWDYQLVHMLWVNNQLCITPKINLVTNIGFSQNATHTMNPKDSEKFLVEAGYLALPLSHPKKLRQNFLMDKAYTKFYFGAKKSILKRIHKSVKHRLVAVRYFLIKVFCKH